MKETWFPMVGVFFPKTWCVDLFPFFSFNHHVSRQAEQELLVRQQRKSAEREAQKRLLEKDRKQRRYLDTGDGLNLENDRGSKKNM